MELKYPFSEVRSVWMNGELVPFADARIHILSHVIHYGSGVFEGLRCYPTARGPAAFRLREHLARLVASARVYSMELPYSVDELCEITLETIRANRLDACYVRPLVYRGFGSIGVNPLSNPVEVVIAAWPTRGKWLGETALEEGVDLCVSSWRRPAADCLPATAKATGNYLNSQLIVIEAARGGFADAIALDAHGLVSEASAANLFVVAGGTLLTPPLAASILPGITRDSVLTLARDLGIPVAVEPIPRGLLYTADELFVAGTSVEITPVRSLDRIPLGTGGRGPITRRLQERYLAIARGEVEDSHRWLTWV